ncbi:hypothetical protein TNCV_949471 [Trichonephila clavipes]|nr:hypothetical protein TNCV_949471 [Trichonephila clavipes]
MQFKPTIKRRTEAPLQTFAASAVYFYHEIWLEELSFIRERSFGLQTGRPGFDARCHQTPAEYTRSTCSLNLWVRSLVGLITSAGTGEYFPPLQFTCRNCGGGDRGRVAIYRPFGEFH